MASEQIDLLSLFGQARKTLKKNQTSLNQADTYNHDHGDHMVEIFDVITQAMKAKQNAEPADQLEYAAQLLRQKTSSGSSTVYANGLEQAAKQVLGKELNIGTIMAIIQALMGTKQPSAQAGGGDLLGSLMGQILSGAGGSGAGSRTSQSAGGDVLGDLIGTMMGGTSGKSTGGQTGQSSGGDVLGDLIGSLAGGSGNASAGSTGSGSGQGLGLDDLLGAGMEYMSAKQSGKSDLEAITGALVKGSTMAQTPHRAESGQVVTDALLGALTKMMKK